jgi:hypothetical protein
VKGGGLRFANLPYVLELNLARAGASVSEEPKLIERPDDED